MRRVALFGRIALFKNSGNENFAVHFRLHLISSSSLSRKCGIAALPFGAATGGIFSRN
jgi:hypothetical protein